MNLSWWCCKHFSSVYLPIITFFLLCTSSCSSSTGDEPTEKPEETIKHTSTSATTITTGEPTILTKSEGITISVVDNTSSEGTNVVNPNINLSEKHDNDEELQARALFRSSGQMWKSAGRMVSKGLRMFRESLLEGAKVAHMFKEDLDEGMSTIMRQNRGVKVVSNNQNQQDESSSSGSFFDSQMLREGVLGGILRFMGVNSKQMGVIALNCLIILAEWITSSMIGNNEVAGVTGRMVKTNLLEWASTGHNKQVEKLLTQAKSHSLPEKIIDTLSEKTGNDTSCVQLLICKMTPVIWGFQDTVKDQFNYSDHPSDIRTGPKPDVRKTHENTTSSRQNPQEEPRGFLATSQYIIDKFMEHLPPKDRMMDFGDRCETKFPHCQLLRFNSLK